MPEETVSTIAANVLRVLTPLVVSGATEFAKKVGASTFEFAKSLLSTVKAKVAGNSEAAQALSRYEADPVTHASELERALSVQLERDEEFKTELAGLFASHAPELNVILNVGIADKLTGVAADEMCEGRVNVDMTVEQARDITGVSIKKIGR